MRCQTCSSGSRCAEGERLDGRVKEAARIHSNALRGAPRSETLILHTRTQLHAAQNAYTAHVNGRMSA